MSPEEAAEALARGRARALSYHGRKDVGPAVAAFSGQSVADALLAAPQPVTVAWVAYSTSIVARFALYCANQGVPLTREAVFDRARIDRFISHGCPQVGTPTRAVYRGRLDIIAQVLLDGANDAPWPRACLNSKANVAPYTWAETGRITAWARVLRPYPRRERVQAIIALGLGAGLHRGALTKVTGEHAPMIATKPGTLSRSAMCCAPVMPACSISSGRGVP